VTAWNSRPARHRHRRLQRDLKQALGPKYSVLNRYEQQADTFRIMKIEKLMSYIFLTLSCSWPASISSGRSRCSSSTSATTSHILRNLGHRQHHHLHLPHGRPLIAILGAVLGILLGLALCLAQQHYGLIKFGQSAGSYITNVYPVSVHAIDILLIFVTVVLVGFVSVLAARSPPQPPHDWPQLNARRRLPTPEHPFIILQHNENPTALFLWLRRPCC
jgi:lipoprotein-releasing system permease protein